MFSFFNEIRLSVRRLSKDPKFTASAVLFLALGISFNVVLFAIVSNVLLADFPYENSDRLVLVWDRYERPGAEPLEQVFVSPLNHEAREMRSRSFDGIGELVPQTFVWTGKGEPELVKGAAISADLLPVLGVEPMRGRSIQPDEVGPGKASRVVLLDHSFWRQRFGGDVDVLGSRLVLDNESYEVVGILPPEFYSPYQGEARLWVPMTIDFADRSLEQRRHHALASFARLKDGVDLEQARTELSGIARQLAEEFPDSNSGWGATVISLREHFVGDVSTQITVLQAAGACLLLIVCANLANLILVRAERYGRELAVRAALGATKVQLSLQFLAEGLVLAMVGGGIGIGAAWFFLGNTVTVSFLTRLLSASTPLTLNQKIELDPQVLLFSLLLMMVTGIGLSLAPIIKAFKINLFEVIKTEGRSVGSVKGNRVLDSFAACEIAITAMLLIAAGLMLESFHNMNSVELGFEPENVLLVRVNLPAQKYADPQARSLFVRRALDAVEPLPGVETAGITTTMPLKNDLEYGRFTIRGRAPASDSEVLFARFGLVSPKYLQTMEIPLIDGRYFRPGDDAEGSGAVIISRAMAERYWPDENPLGKEIQRTGRPTEGVPWLRVVGVVEDVIYDGASEGVEPSYYLPYEQHPEQNLAVRLSLVLRTQVEPESLTESVRAAIRVVDPQLPIKESLTMDEVVASSLSEQRTSLSIISTFGTVAFLLAVLGIYGVLSYFVTQRAQEIGIRMAFGAQSADVVKLILRRAVLLTIVGLVIGVVGASVLTRFIENQLYGIEPLDLATFGTTAIILLAVALGASFLPAYRASRLDPNKILKAE